jgi:hypothetical protein
MDTSVAKDMIRVIRAELDSRKRDFRATEDPDMGDLWPAMGEPFFNELCLALLLAISHHVERELVLLVAQVAGNGRELDGEEYGKLVQKAREQLNKGKAGWEAFTQVLNLNSAIEWGSMQMLRHLANAYKHQPFSAPSKALLKYLGLDTGRNYASLPESPTLKEGLAAFLNLPDSADYCDIADELVARVDRFLAGVKGQKLVLSRIRFKIASPHDPDSWAW